MCTVDWPAWSSGGLSLKYIQLAQFFILTRKMRDNARQVDDINPLLIQCTTKLGSTLFRYFDSNARI